MTVSENFMEWVYEIERERQGEKVSFVKFDNQNSQKNSKKRKVGFIAVDEETGKIAKSFCNPSDDYNPLIGRAIAYARLRGIEIPPMEKPLTVEECVGKVVTINKVEYYVTPISQGRWRIGKYLPDKFLCIRISKPYIIKDFSCFTINANIKVDSCREISLKEMD